MLKLLRIENFALIESLEIPFSPGLNVLTGETGAGKSIILDALDAALGGTVSGKLVRTGAKKAMIEAMFSPDPVLEEWLHQQQIDLLDDGIVCSREIASRTSRSRINGVLINKQQLARLRGRLVEITAQGQTIHLQDPQTQRRWLDGLGGPKLALVRQEVQEAHQIWYKLKTTLESRQADQQNRLQRLDILEFQSQELNSLKLGEPDEIETLERERDRLAHSVDLQKQSYEAYQLLYQGEGDAPAAADLLGQAERVLEDMVEWDPELQPLLEMISNALIQVEEAGRELQQYGEDLEVDPGRLNKIERRLVKLKQACRKYGPTLMEVIAHADRVTLELDSLKDEGTSLEELESSVAAARQQLGQACEQLTGLRAQAATRLQKRLIGELQPLGMSKVAFEVQIKPISPMAEGADQITFLFSPNPGEPLQPLAAIASGGEMSRFLLAMKAVFTQVDPVATMVFDEIDAGVSGKMAQAIGTKLSAIAQDHQLLCVTHQPLVAALADQHMRVSKQMKKKRTVVQVDLLSEAERREELAQLTAGHSAQEAMGFVDSLLAQAAQMRDQEQRQKV